MRSRATHAGRKASTPRFSSIEKVPAKSQGFQECCWCLCRQGNTIDNTRQTTSCWTNGDLGSRPAITLGQMATATTSYQNGAKPKTTTMDPSRRCQKLPPTSIHARNLSQRLTTSFKSFHRCKTRQKTSWCLRKHHRF